MEDSADIESRNYSYRTISGQSIDLALWPTPEVGGLDDGARQHYLAKRAAVALYLSGVAPKQIKDETGFGARYAYKLIRERCLQLHPDGKIYGWRALISNLTIKKYTRNKPIRIDNFGGGGAGALGFLLSREPALNEAFTAFILTSRSNSTLVEIKRTPKRFHAWFLDHLRGLGYEARGEWPFSTASRGYFSVRRHVQGILAANPRALAMSQGGPDLVKKLQSGDGVERPVERFMQRVEMDAHKIDARLCVAIPRGDGSYQEKIIHRLWVVVIIEVMSRAVLGYYLSLRKEVSADDVLRAIKCALTHWPLRPVNFSDTAYKEGAGMPSTIHHDLVGLCWDEISVDGALAETCSSVKSRLRDVVGAVVLDPKNSFSKARRKDDRPFIESFFRNLSSKGVQRLSNTTGAKLADRRGTDPERVALNSRFQYEYMEELLATLVANYNASEHTGIGGRTPIAYARFLFDHSKCHPRKVDPESVATFFSVRKQCIVRGGAKVGRAPYVEFYNARYTNTTLQNRHDLVGKPIWVICHKEDDCRVARAATSNGQPLGVLRAAPPWHRTPHSLSVRAAIVQATARGQFSVPPRGDAIVSFCDWHERNPKGKMPVHPAYLEARRILAQANDFFVGDRALEKAMGRTGSAQPVPPHDSLPNQSPGTRDLRLSPSPQDNSSRLPPPRMARAK
ncbi:hypothetical protein [Achromobacter aegrifaciens]